MKICGVTFRAYTYALRRPIGDVNLPEGADDGLDLAVQVESDEGIVGESVGTAAAAQTLPQLAQLVDGADPRSVRGCWDRMVALAFKGGLHGAMAAGISAIDRALWDLRAKINGVPLWKELGGAGRRVRAYASGLDTPLSDEQLYTFYAGLAARGVRAGKLKVGRDADEDERRLRVMIDALASSGRRPQLIIDANEFWSPKQAVQRVSQLERHFDFLWVEEPVRRYDFEGLRRVSEGIRAPVASGENFSGPQEFVPLLTLAAADVIQISSHVAGFTGAAIVAEMASMFDRPVVVGPDVGHSMAHLASTWRHHVMMEVFDVGRDAALVDTLPIEDGCIVLNDTPGAGISFNRLYIESHQPIERPARTLAAVYARADDAGLLG
ncbi:MAG TPA: mandelate racemase/muconate lactonizing enzyme family protein [Acidimicrobiales bacterium]|nr:mandelate racemase/muconate lactonizing enzyme family protein [Acidimicrobiales bacterium]